MPIVPLNLVPGVNVEATETLNQSGISSCQFIRFKAKLPQKLGGWARFLPNTVGGVPRDLHAWQDLNTNDRLAVGASGVTIITDGAATDITPRELISDCAPAVTTTIGSSIVEVFDANISNLTTLDSVSFNTPIAVGGIVVSGGPYQIQTIPGNGRWTIDVGTPATSAETDAGAVPSFTTTSGSSEVSVHLTANGMSAGEKVVFPISTSVGGVTIMGTYTVLRSATDTFVISASNQATSSTSANMNGGDAEYIYSIALGPAAIGAGYGTGPYGIGGYGTGVVPTTESGVPIVATDWSLDNWGEILLANPSDGGIYYWSPTSGFQNLSIVSDGPPFNGGIFVAMPEQILVAWGSSVVENIGVDQDPLLVRWSDSLNFLEWTVTSTTQAGSFRIPTGSRIKGAVQGPQQALIWTDIDVWAMQYLGPPLVFGFNKISSGCGLIGQHARVVMRGSVYWMSPNNFWVLGGGGVQEIPCTVWDAVFQNLDTDNQHKCIAAANSSFDEVTFYYPSLSGTGENDSYVKYNIVENTWDYGALGRSAWIDQSVLGQPIGASPQGLIFQHEISQNADGQPMNWYFETGWFVISEAQGMAFVDWFFPDMKFGLFNGTQNATVLVTITSTDYPNGTERVFGPFTMTAASTFINTRLRGRQIKIKFEGNDLDSFARLGLMRYRVAQDGRR